MAGVLLGSGSVGICRRRGDGLGVKARALSGKDE